MKTLPRFTGTRIKAGLLFPLIALLLLTVKGQVAKEKSSFKIVGYYSLRGALTDSLTNVPFNKVTHLNLWFLNPDSAGNFMQDLYGLGPFIEAAHSNGVKVLASIGGGSAHPYYHNLLKEGRRSVFIDSLFSLVLRCNLDGIDVDLEGSDIDENYENFVTGLADVLKPRGKLITAAVAIYYKDAMSDKALAAFDFVNVMSYDRTGPWTPDRPGPHSTYAHATEDLAYFGKTKAIPKERMVLGVPFYGYGFGPEVASPAISMDYGQIITSFPNAEFSDEFKMPDGKILYYNGINTIVRKTTLAKKKASGIMIWQLQGDAAAPHSLLDAINRAAYGKE